VVRPSLVRSGRHLSKIIEEEERNIGLNNEIDTYLEDRDSYYFHNAEYQKLAMELPDKDDTIILTNEIYEIARHTNIDIDSLTFNEKKIDVEDLGKIPAKEISIDIVLEGSYYEVLNFINTIEIMPRIVKIENVLIQNVSGDYDNLSTFINAKTFFINEYYRN
jgi:Tfp pilus assembly protein PilO